MRRLLVLPLLMAISSPALAVPRVVASIMPVHSIASAVMGDLGKPELLFRGRLSEHTASLTPAQLTSLAHADLVFMVSHALEFRLGEIDSSEAVGGKRFVQLADAPGVMRLPVRNGATWEPDADGPQPAAAADNSLVLSYDPHVWMDPENAKAMAAEIAVDLGRADPANAMTYAANARTFGASLGQTESSIAAIVKPLAPKTFIVSHDAYRYFETRFGLHAAGSISDVSAVSPSAQRLQQIRSKVTATGAACVFREPQFDDKYVRAITEDTAARSGVLDGLGADLTPGPGAYGQMLTNLAVAFKACLDG